MTREHRSEAEYRESMSVVQDAARRLTRIVDDIFLLARADAGNLVMQQDGKGQMLRQVYDLLDRVTFRDLPPAGSDANDVRYFYDGALPTSCGSCEDFCAATVDTCDAASLTSSDRKA